MKYHVIEAFKVRISQVELELLPGQIITLACDNAEKLIAAGKIRPLDIDVSIIPEEVKEDYEERAAIMEYDGGLSREEAEIEAMKLVLKKRMN